jgi:hypothetical protein
VIDDPSSNALATVWQSTEIKPLNTTDRRAGVLNSPLKGSTFSKSPSSSVSGPEGQIERFRERETLPKVEHQEVFEGNLVEAQSNSISWDGAESL